jgi:hypothetical protein
MINSRLLLQIPMYLCLLGVTGCGDQKTGSNDGNRGDNGNTNQPDNPTAQSQGDETARTGSTARFTILGDRLYAVSGGGLAAFDVTDAKKPEKVGFSAVSGDIETIHNDGQNLFIGSQNALYIYNVDDPDKPERESMLNHARACDPVVTQDNIAFVTLRSGISGCPGGANQLKIIDVSDREKPSELSSYDMTGPKGLGIVEGTRLFVCDGSKGLVELDVENPKSIAEKNVIKDEVCSDVIPTEEVLLVTGEAGISQYDLTVANPSRLSRIEIGQTPDSRDE